MHSEAPSDAAVEGAIPDYKPIADYGVIGDMHSAALIASDGSIDWACLPDFDSPAVFLRLLDRQKGGYCAIAVDGALKRSRRYLDGTNILETTFTAGSGSVIVTDFMPVGDEHRGEHRDEQGGRIVRLFRCSAGLVDLRVEIKPTLDFARNRTRVDSPAAGITVFEGAGVRLAVHAPRIEIREDGAARCAFRLRAGETESVTISCGTAERCDPVSALEQTQRFWTDWSGRLVHEGRYRDQILRGILTLKLLTFAPTGAIVAAPTTSLPETVGGKRNWDYRLSWIRDSEFVLTAFMHCGYFEEAHRFFQFLKEAAKGPVEEMRILYSIHGERAEDERELNHLDGYRHSRPVRDGNAAGGQKQSDIFGELLNCMYVYCHIGRSEAEKKERAAEVWPMAQAVADYTARRWREPDHGIWELRGKPRQYVHSKAMCWAALDRAMRLGSIADAKHDARDWRRERDEISASIGAHGFNAKLGAFVESYESDALDAAVLAIPLQGVIDAADPRVRSTVELLERRLLKNGLLRRREDEERAVEEGAFALCTVWLINYYVLVGGRERARNLLDHLLSFQNELGLFSEEINPRTGEQLGNFPQALTHVGLISAIRHLEGGLQPGAMAMVRGGGTSEL